jgi:hypothetical protein
MSNRRPSFAKRDREMKLKDKARAKAERRAARKAERTRTPSTDAENAAPDATVGDTPAPAPGADASIAGVPALDPRP